MGHVGSGQLFESVSSLPPLCGLQGLGSGCQPHSQRPYPLNHLAGSEFVLGSWFQLLWPGAGLCSCCKPVAEAAYI